jgi:hypothetical protein
MQLPRPALDVFDDLLGGRFGFPGSLSHLHSLTVQMSQKSSATQSPQSVPRVLMPDN